MIQDKKNMFDEANAITATRNSTNVILTGSPGALARNVGVGEELTISITVDETFTAAGAGTLTIAIVTDDNAALTSPTILYQTAALALAALVAAQEPIHLKVPIATYEAYLGLVYTVATGPMTAGKVTAGIVHDIQRSKAYPNAFVSA